MAAVDEEIRKRTVVVNGVSKTYAMTAGESVMPPAGRDHRRGHKAAEPEYVKSDFHCAVGCLEALNGNQDSVG